MSPALLIGATSFIGQALGTLPGIKAVSHTAPNLADLIDSHDVIINCAFDPALRTQPYDIKYDFDSKIAERITRTSQRLVVLSSRAVYGHTQAPMHEDMALQPSTPYGINKAKIEENCRNLLGDRLLVLRLSNVFGYEWPPKPGRTTFMSQVLSTLKIQNRITFDIAAASKKDFLPVAEVAAIIAKLVNLKATGIYNLSAGTSLSMAAITEALIKGYGAAEVEFQTSRIDSFYMDASKLKQLVRELSQSSEILYEFEKIGQRLAETGKD